MHPLRLLSLLLLLPVAHAANPPAPAQLWLSPPPAGEEALRITLGGVKVGAEGRWSPLPVTGDWQSLWTGPASSSQEGVRAWIRPVSGEKYRLSWSPCEDVLITREGQPTRVGRVRVDLDGTEPMELISNGAPVPLKPGLSDWIPVMDDLCVGGAKKFGIVRPGADSADMSLPGCEVHIRFLNAEDVTISCMSKLHAVSVD